MEATADKIKFYLIIQVVTLPDRLDVDDTDVVILHGDSERLLIAVESHAEDLLAFCRRRLPPGFEVIVVLARR